MYEYVSVRMYTDMYIYLMVYIYHFAASQRWRHESIIGSTTISLAEQRVSIAELCHQ